MRFNVTATRAGLRASLLKTIARRTAIEVVMIDGVETQVELRQLTVGERDKVLKGEDGMGRITVRMVMASAFSPGTDDKVFEPGDEKTLLDIPTSAWLDKLGRKALELNGPEAAEVGKA